MNGMDTINSLLRTLACLTIAMAIVLFPMSEAHAQTGAHPSHHEMEMSAQAEGDHCGIEATAPDHCHASTQSADTSDPHSSDQCCQGTCLSVVLQNHMQTAAEHVEIAHDAQPQTRMVSIDTAGFLRPPNT